MGPSQEAKDSPWRHASSSSSCLVTTGTVKQLQGDRAEVEIKAGLSWKRWLKSSDTGSLCLRSNPNKAVKGGTHFFLLRRSLSAGPRVPVLFGAMRSPEAWSSEGVDAVITAQVSGRMQLHRGQPCWQQVYPGRWSRPCPADPDDPSPSSQRVVRLKT